MLITAVPNEVTGDLGGEKKEFTVDATALNHIMNVLTELYSNPHEAVIREIITNALDSHAISGQKLPVKVSAPSFVNPFFEVEDFGTGMSTDDLKTIYSSYGTSTKRGNNIEAGQLGLGSKSPFAITSQFTIRSRKDGIETMAMLSRNEQNSAQIEIVDVSATDEPNGVRLQIPMSRTYSTSVDKFVQYVRPGLVELNGALNQIPDNWLQINENLYVSSDQYSGSVVVMGNVAYFVSAYGSPLKHRGTISYIPMGAVAFTPSREELMYNHITNETLEQLEQSISDDVDGYVEKFLSEDRKPYEKVDFWKHIRRFARAGTAAAKLLDDDISLMTMRKNGDKVNHYDGTRYIDINRELATIAVITESKRKRTDRRLFDSVVDHFDQIIDVVVVTDKTKSEMSGYFPDTPMVSDVDLKKSRKRSAPRTPRKSTPSEMYKTIRGGMIDSKSLRGYEKVLYTGKQEMGYNSSVAVRRGEIAVYVTPSKQDSFKKKFKNAAHLNDVYAERREKIRATVENAKGYGVREVTALSSCAFLLGSVESDVFQKAVRLSLSARRNHRLGNKWHIYTGSNNVSADEIDVFSRTYPLLMESMKYAYSINKHAKMAEHIKIYVDGVDNNG